MAIIRAQFSDAARRTARWSREMNQGFVAPLPLPLRIECVPVHPFTVDSLHDYIRGVIETGSRARIYNVNVHALNLARKLPAFRRSLQGAEAVFCDGEG